MKIPAVSFLDAFCRAGLTTEAARASGSISRACRESEANKTIKSPPTLQHRYILEDVGYGLVPISALAALARVKTPTIDALIVLASEAIGTDLRAGGLNLKSLGLEGLSPEELPRFIETGRRKAPS